MKELNAIFKTKLSFNFSRIWLWPVCSRNLIIHLTEKYCSSNEKYKDLRRFQIFPNLNSLRYANHLTGKILPSCQYEK